MFEYLLFVCGKIIVDMYNGRSMNGLVGIWNEQSRESL